VVEIAGQPGLVMELVEGLSLDDLIKQQKLTIEQADAIGRGVLSGVAHAHGRGLIHRDLKPANVMLQITEDGLVPKVTDFGLAKILAGDDLKARTRTGATMGTPQYMSPEQIRDSKNVDARSDVFAVGGLLYEIATGQRAFDGDNLLEIFSKVTSGEFVDPRSLRPDVPERMADAILRALVVDPEVRIESCKELFSLWTAGEKMPARTFSAEELAGLSRSMLPAPPLDNSTHEIELPGSADTLLPPASQPPRSMAPTMMLGGGLMFVGIGLAAIAVLIAIGIGVIYSRPTEPVFIERKVLVDRPVEAPHPDSHGGEVAPAVDPAPRPGPIPPVQPSPDPVSPGPVSPDPVLTEPPEDPDPPVEDGLAWEDLPEEMRDPAFVPEPIVDPEPVEEPVTEPEPEPVVEESPALNSVPMSMRSGPRDTRRNAIERARADAVMTPHFITLVRRSNDDEIRKSAFGALMYQWENRVGDPDLLQAEAIRAIRTDLVWMRFRALEAWAKVGTSLQTPSDALGDPSHWRVRMLAARAVAAVGKRTGQQAEAARLISGRAAVETHGKVLKELDKQARSLGG